MTSSERDNNLDNLAINLDLLRHSEYDIEVNDNNGDNALVIDVRKLVIEPTFAENSIKFRKSKNTLLVIPVKDIEDIDVRNL